jgi:hypothetical protein
MNIRICCAACRVEFESDEVGATLCDACDRTHWLEEQRQLEAVLAKRRRAKMQGTTPPMPGETACRACGYAFDHGSHGARMCPNCIAQDEFDMRHAVTVTSAWEWLMRKFSGRPSTIH